MNKIIKLTMASAFAVSMISSAALAQSTSNTSGTSVTNGQSRMEDPMSDGNPNTVSGTQNLENENSTNSTVDGTSSMNNSTNSMDTTATGSIKRDCTTIVDDQERLNCQNMSGTSVDSGETSGAGNDGVR